jgi:hypothetical protein
MLTSADPSPPDFPDPALDSLLAREEISIVDGLLALPGTTEIRLASDRWTRAVNGRLEARLAERMRRVIGAAAG